MRAIRGDSLREMQKHRSRMFVGGNGLAKGNVAEILQRVGDSVVDRVAGFPKAVAFGKFFGSEGSEAKQIVRAVLDHVDAEIVSRVNAKIGPMLVAKRQSTEFDDAVEGRMLHAFDFGNVH